MLLLLSYKKKTGESSHVDCYLCIIAFQFCVYENICGSFFSFFFPNSDFNYIINEFNILSEFQIFLKYMKIKIKMSNIRQHLIRMFCIKFHNTRTATLFIYWHLFIHSYWCIDKFIFPINHKFNQQGHDDFLSFFLF